jgi:hypothetical protein
MKEDGFMLRSQDLPITMLLRVGVAEAHRPARRIAAVDLKQYRRRHPELEPDSPRREALSYD